MKQWLAQRTEPTRLNREKMTRKLLLLGPLGLSLAAPGAYAQAAAATAAPAAPAANPVDPASVQALRDMGVHVQKLERFRATMRSPRPQRVLHFDGTNATLYVRALKVSSTVELNETLARKKVERP
jgi:hypothetical protein